MNYEKYSLDNLTEWVHDAMGSDASPHEIYSTIREAVQEDYSYHKERASRAFGLLELMSGHRPVADDNELYKAALAERKYYEGSDKSVLACDKDDPSPECKEAWTDFWEQSFQSNIFDHPEDYEEFKKEQNNKNHSPSYYEYDRNDLTRKSPFRDKVTKWKLPVEVDGPSGEYYVQFPDDLLEVANLKEGDLIEWIDQDDGSYLLKKVEKKMSYDEMIAAGYSMTDDGFWIKEN